MWCIYKADISGGIPHQHAALSLHFSAVQSQNICIFVPCFVFQVVSDAAGQGVTITGTKTFNNWNWPNAVIFAATVITTIGKSFVHFELYYTHTHTCTVPNIFICLRERIWEYRPQNLSRAGLLHLLRTVWCAFMSHLDQRTWEILWRESQAPWSISNQKRLFPGQYILILCSYTDFLHDLLTIAGFFLFPEEGSVYLYCHFYPLGCVGPFSTATFCFYVPRGLDVYRRVLLFFCDFDHHRFWGPGSR